MKAHAHEHVFFKTSAAFGRDHLQQKPSDSENRFFDLSYTLCHMNATTLYVEACKYMLALEEDNSVARDRLFHLLPKLRQSLSCRVCRGLLVEPYGSHSCLHYVCRGCLRKKRSLNPGCRWCLNLDSLVEDKQIRIVLACYQKLCEYVVKSTAARLVTTQNGEFNKTQAILQEAVTSPISLAEPRRDQQLQSTGNSVTTGQTGSRVNFKMATARSRDLTGTLPTEVKPLSKRKLLQLVAEPAESADAKLKKKKRKHFKGTCYNYNKKKKHMIGKLNRDVNTIDTPAEKSETVALENGIPAMEDGSEEIQIVDDIVEDQPESKVPIISPPAIKSVTDESKLRCCRCGTYTKLANFTSPRCISSRCPCFSGGYTCEHCRCACCANPFNNNNNNEKSSKDVKLKFVDDKNVLISGD